MQTNCEHTAGPVLSDNLLKHFILPIAGIVLLATAVVLGLMVLSSQRQNQQQLVQERKLVERAVAADRRLLGENIISYSEWTDTVLYGTLTIDPQWLDENVGLYVYETFGYEYTFVVRADGSTTYSSREDQRVRLDAGELLGPSFAKVFAKVKQLPEGRDARLGGLTYIDGKPAMFHVGLIMPESTASGTAIREQMRGRQRGYLVFVEMLDAPLLKGLADGYGLEQLRLAAESDAMYLLSVDDNSRRIGLAWQPKRPGSEIFLSILPILILFIVLMVAGSVFLVRKAKAALAAADRSTRELLSANHAAQVRLEQRMREVSEENDALQEAKVVEQAMLAGKLAAIRSEAARQFSEVVTESLARLQHAARELDVASSAVSRSPRIRSNRSAAPTKQWRWPSVTSSASSPPLAN